MQRSKLLIYLIQFKAGGAEARDYDSIKLSQWIKNQLRMTLVCDELMRSIPATGTVEWSNIKYLHNWRCLYDARSIKTQKSRLCRADKLRFAHSELANFSHFNQNQLRPSSS